MWEILPRSTANSGPLLFRQMRFMYKKAAKHSSLLPIHRLLCIVVLKKGADILLCQPKEKSAAAFKLATKDSAAQEEGV